MIQRSAVLLFLMLLPFAAKAVATCQPISDEKGKQLAEFVQQKYRLAFKVAIRPSDITPIGDTCYRKIKFTPTSGADKRFSLSVYLSPDLRFLTRDLMDSTTNPLEVDRIANE